MKLDPKIRSILAALAVLLMEGMYGNGAWAQSGDDQGRISYATDDALLRGEGDDEWSYAGINTLILPGDRVWADDSGAVEVELPYGYFVRLADGSELEVVSMPRDGLVRGWIGSFYVQRTDYSRGDLLFETPAASFDFEQDTVARIDVLVDGGTTLSVIDGRVGVYTGNDRTMDVSSGYRVYIDPGFLPSNPERFYRDNETDSFDRWNRLRANRVADDDIDLYFRDDEYRPVGVRDLNDHGNWIYVDNTRYWRPTYVHDFVPYRHGRWSYTRHQGYVWVGHHPFSYVTSHYGYWHHHHHHGWIWSYDPHYAPSRVVTFRRGDLFLWAPANRHGHPVHTDVDFSIGDFNFSFGFTSYAHANHVIYQDHHQYPVHPYYRTHHHGHHGHHSTYYWRPHHDRFANHWWNHHHYKRFEHRRHVPTHCRRGPVHHPYGDDARVAINRLNNHHGRDQFYVGGAPALTKDQRRTIHRKIARQANINREHIQNLRERVQRVAERRTTTARTALEGARTRTAPDGTVGSRTNPRQIPQIPRLQADRLREQQQSVREQAARRVEQQREILSKRSATAEVARERALQFQQTQREQVQRVQSRMQQNQETARERLNNARTTTSTQRQQLNRERTQATQRVVEQQRNALERQRELIQQRNDASQRAVEQQRTTVQRQREIVQQRNDASRRAAEQQRTTVQRQREIVQQRNDASQRVVEQRRNAVQRQRELVQQRSATADRVSQQRREAVSRVQQQHVRSRSNNAQARSAEAARSAAQARQQQIRAVQQRTQQINAQRSQAAQQMIRARQQAAQKQMEAIQSRSGRNR